MFKYMLRTGDTWHLNGDGGRRYSSIESDWSELMFYHVRCGECRGLKQVPKSEVVLP